MAGDDGASPRREKTISTRTSKVVQDAAGILEEELAMGIDMARNIEQRVFSRERERGEQDPEAVVLRFRRDAHEIVDLAVDLLSGALGTLGSVADRAVRISSDLPVMADDLRASNRDPAGAAGVPTLVMPDPVAAGETADIAMQVENDSDTPTDTFALNASDLVSGEGHRIGAKQISFTPTELQISPHEAEKITVSVKVPAAVKPGTYSGLLQATKLAPVRAVLVVNIA
jgi:hypothetical protein